MKKYFFCFLLLLYASLCFSQYGTAIYEVVYSPKNLIPHEYEGVLNFGDNKSLFVYEKVVYANEQRKDTIIDGQITLMMHRGANSDKYGKYIYLDLTSNSLIARDFIVRKPFIYSDSIPKIKWSIEEKNTKKVGNYICQGATCMFYGRNYEVWFAPGIPIMAGPWKLQGLPGLIMEARSTDDEVLFRLKRFTIGPKKMEIHPEGDGEKLNKGYAEFRALQDKKAEDAFKNFQANVNVYSKPGLKVVAKSTKLSRFELSPE